MISLFTEIEFENAKYCDKLNLRCYHCDKIFASPKKIIKYELKNKRGNLKFCSKDCQYNSQTKKVKVNCKNCNVEFMKMLKEFKKSPNSFCSQSCSATYNNTHKTFGVRRSKLEKWLEENLINLYPNLEMHFNRKDTINAELDIYVPSLKLAFELNGIFHYKPIYGENKLKAIKENDTRKFQACLKKEIELCIIDTYNVNYSEKEKNQIFLDIITNLVNQKLKVTSQLLYS